MNASHFRNLALAMPEAVESSHMGHPDFRVRGKIFATLSPDEDWGVLKLDLDQQEAFVLAHPTMFEAAPGGWGRRGYSRVPLQRARVGPVREAMAAAWFNAAPRALRIASGLRPPPTS